VARVTMKDHRISEKGERLTFTCGNRRYRTNIGKGEAHWPHSTVRGSVFAEPLVKHNGYTLWLEHVIEVVSGEKCYWLMWYDPDGLPTIPLSSIFDHTDLEQMAKLLVRLVP